MTIRTDTGTPTVGLIVPPAHGQVPAHGPALYGDRVRFLGAGLGLATMSIDGYDAVIGRVGELAADLAARGAEAVVLMGTSLSFYRGVEFDSELVATMEHASDRPATTMSRAIVAGLRAVGAVRVAVATGYTPEVDARLVAYLAASGVDAVATAGLGVVDTDAAQVVPVGQVAEVADRAVTRARAAGGPLDGLLVSCGALDTLDLVPQLEQRHGLPVVASSPAGFWAAAGLVGADAPIPGRGALLSHPHGGSGSASGPRALSGAGGDRSTLPDAGAASAGASQEVSRPCR